LPVAGGVTVWEPEVASAPLQEPAAVQDVVSVEVHVNVLDWP
jgi:hypothetical protein